MSKIVSAFILCLLFLNNIYFDVNASDLGLSAQSSVLMETESGKILYGKNENVKLPIASITKIMTCIVALEFGNLDDIVTVSKKAVMVEGSKMYLKENEKIKLETLLYGLMLNSGNDAAIAISEHISGSVDEFVNLMNKTAKKIGAKNTNFKNANGLHHDEHYSTSYDMALITRYGLKNEKFQEIVKTKTKNVAFLDGTGARTLSNHNRLLKEYLGCDGVKTGFTKASGRTLVTSVTRDKLQLIAVTLNAPNDWNDHKILYNYGFNNFMNQVFVNEGEVKGKIDVIDGETNSVELKAKKDCSVFLSIWDKDKYKVELDIQENVEAPVYNGQILGYIKLLYNNELIKKVPLISNTTVKNINYKEKLAFFEIIKLNFIKWLNIT